MPIQSAELDLEICLSALLLLTCKDIWLPQTGCLLCMAHPTKVGRESGGIGCHDHVSHHVTAYGFDTQR